MHEYLFDHDRLDAYRLSSTSTSTTNSQNQALHRSLRSVVFGLRQSQLLGLADQRIANDLAWSKNIVLLFVLVLSPPRRTVLVLGEIKRSDQSHGSASYPEPPRSTICIAAVQTAIEYE